MPHQEGKLEKRHTWFLLRSIFGFIASGLIIAGIVGLVVIKLLDLGWGIFFLSYFIILLILDIYWETDIILIKHRWLEWIKTRDDADFLKNIKESQEYRYWKRFYQRRVVFMILYLIFILFWGIWGFIVSQKFEVLLLFIIFVVIFGVRVLLKYPDVLRK
jgi:MFS family permease